MAEPIVYIDSSEIREGKLGKLKEAMKELVDFVAEREPQLLSYGFYLSEHDSRVDLVAIHPDLASLEFHMDLGGPAFAKFKDLISLSKIEVYGQIDEPMLRRLKQKAEMLGSGTVIVHERFVGFARLAKPPGVSQEIA